MSEQPAGNEPAESFGPGGRYVIRRELGRGMMGVVYEAEDTVLGRTVALKTIELAFGTGEETRAEFEERFFTEARVAASLSHPWIVVCHDVGKDPASGRLFIVFEYLRGRTLAERIAGEAMDWREALAIVVRMARAIQHAHACGVIHRDLKPANVMLLERGPEDSHPGDVMPIKIMDFGVARLESLPARLTKAGQSFGSPLYMSPEQILGQGATARSDIFSLGSVLCTLLLGRAWFDARSIPEILARVVHDEAPVVSSLRQGLPAALDAVVARALAKRAEDRYGSAAAMADDLDDVGTGRAPRHASRLAAAAETREPGGAGSPQAAGASRALRHVTVEAADPLASLLEGAPLEAVTPDVPSPLMAELTLPVRADSAQAALENPAEWTLPSWEMKPGSASTSAAGENVLQPAGKTTTPAAEPSPTTAPKTLQPRAEASLRRRLWLWGGAAAAVVLLLAGVWRLQVPAPAPARPAAEEPQGSSETPPAPASTAVSASTPPPKAAVVVQPSPARHPAPEATSPPSTATPTSVEVRSRAGARLLLDVVHPFESGRLIVWIDGGLVYETKLEAPVSKKIVAIRVREGHLTKTLDVAPGRHEVRVEVSWDDEHRSGSRVVDVAPGSTGTLQVRLGKITRGVGLKWNR